MMIYIYFFFIIIQPLIPINPNPKSESQSSTLPSLTEPSSLDFVECDVPLEAPGIEGERWEGDDDPENHAHHSHAHR